MEFSTNQPAVSIRHLSKSLSGRPILRDINIDVYPGEIFGFLGPNGSGKTTTIKLMLGLLRIDQGEILIDGHDVKTDFEAALEGIGGIIENPELYKYLTGWENLDLFRRMYRDIPVSRIDEVVALVGLQARIHDKVARYSLGMRQRLGVAQALLNHPKLLVLDEPTNGLDPEGIHDLRDLMKKLAREEQVAVFVSSHLLSELEQMCDKVGIIDRGALVAVRSMTEMHTATEGKDGMSVYRYETPAEDAALSLLRGAGFETEKTEGGVRVTLPKTRLQEVLRLFVENGIPLEGFCEVKRSLEEAFLEMTKGGSAVGTNENAAFPNSVDPPISPAVTREDRSNIYVPPSEQTKPEEKNEGKGGNRHA